MALPATVRRAFETALSPENVITDRVQCRAYECDGLTGYRVVPELVLLPLDAAQVAAAVRVCAEHRVPFVARGAGTGLSGGALPVADGVVISLARLKRVLEVDPVDRRATVEPGVTNLEITAAAAPHGLYYAPDPSSQQVCTIGGNVAENSGGAHCLKYGFTTNHVLELEVVLADGSVVTLGSDTGEQAGPDLRGVFLGSEGTLGITTKIVVRLLRTPESVRTLLADFPSVRAAGDVVSDIVGAGIVPAAVEMMDTPRDRGRRGGRARRLHGRRPGRAGRRAGRPRGRVRRRVRPGEGDLRTPRVHPAARRRVAGGARRDLAGSQGGVRGGRPHLPRLLRAGRRRAPHPARRGAGRIGDMGDEAGLRVANVFHAGDGNLHPLVLYSAAAGETDRAEHLSGAIAELCVELGGSLSGEHGIGTDKACSMPKMFGEEDLATMARVRAAFDPHGLCNPGKVLPTPRLCGERPGRYRPHPLEEAGVIERL